MDSTGGDDTLVRQVLAGDRQAYAPLVARHRRAAIACATAILGSANDAEDVAQDAFVRAFQRLDTCRDHARFGGWLLSIVRHAALNHVRAGRRRPTVPLDDAPPLTAPARADAHGPPPRALLDALQQLTATQREILLLADLADLSHAEIAARTGVSLLMSRRHLSEARRIVRDFLRTADADYSRR